MTVGKTLKRSFVMGYGASAGHSAWRGTKDNILAIVLLALLFIAFFGPLYFVYKFGKSLLERPEEGESKAARIAIFGGGTVLTAMYLGWILFFGSVLLYGTGISAYIPGAQFVPGAVSEAVIVNAEKSFVRSVKLIGGGKDMKEDHKPWDRNDPGNKDLVLVGNATARIYLAIFVLGLAAGYRQGKEASEFDGMMSHNMAFFVAHGLDLSEDGIVSDEEGNTFRIEERTPRRITLMALHRRNMRGYIDLDASGRMVEWSGLVRRGTA